MVSPPSTSMSLLPAATPSAQPQQKVVEAITNNMSQSNGTTLLEELYENCRSESLSEDGLRVIIERHECTPNNPDIHNCEFFHQACDNEKVTDGIIQYLLEYFPNTARAVAEEGGHSPLDIICLNKNITLGMVQLLIDAAPDSFRHGTNNCSMPLHKLCLNNNLEDEVGLDILDLLLQRCPESVRHADTDGDLPIHIAAGKQSPEFCRVLVEAYPGSEQMTGDDGMLPFHWACQSNTVATAKYLYKLYPECINVADTFRMYPIHHAIVGLKHRSNPEAATELVQFLLHCNPGVVLHKFSGKVPLFLACGCTSTENTSMLNARLKVLQVLYDAHPEAIESNDVTSNVGSFCQEVQTFINTQLTYARQARDHHLMHSSDENGQLPLHRALQNNVTLGSIKLLVKGNSSAVRCPDNAGMIPLHIACQHNESPVVVEYLIGLNKVTLTTADREGNTVLHHVCIGANHAIIALLLGKYESISIAKRNAHNQLPIHLLLESNHVRDRDDTKYVESIFRLLSAHPETIGVKEEFNLEPKSCLSPSRNKRKFGMK